MSHLWIIPIALVCLPALWAAYDVIKSRPRPPTADSFKAVRLDTAGLRCTMCGQPLQDGQTALSTDDGVMVHLVCDENALYAHAFLSRYDVKWKVPSEPPRTPYDDSTRRRRYWKKVTER